MKIQRTFDFGKIDFEEVGVKRNLVTVEVGLDFHKGKWRFSASANVYNSRQTDIVCGGQCFDDIFPYMTDEKFFKIYRLWKLYHLNDMHPECEHQRALGWEEKAKKKIIVNEEQKSAGWVRESEHPDGLLCKPCPVCGYKYGTAWCYMPIPPADLSKIKQLIEKGV